MATKKSRVLVIGGTGFTGKFMVEGSVKAGNPTFALVREASLSDPVKAKTVQRFKDLGVTILHGDLNDHESLVKAMKQVDVVISTVGRVQLLDQTKIISAIKEAGNVKRFLPSEFGTDVDKTGAVEPAKSLVFGAKRRIRRAVEAEGIPYTYVVNNCAAGLYLRTLVQFQPGLTSPPRDKVTILGDGNAKVVKKKEQEWYLWEELSYISKESVNTCGIILQVQRWRDLRMLIPPIYVMGKTDRIIALWTVLTRDLNMVNVVSLFAVNLHERSGFWWFFGIGGWQALLEDDVGAAAS
ncbi:hypothetical protein F2Q69_00051636 [Brassica cretica]|uniref:NmrA-like domain-containing protein n=1 Tax=Brassica cretica TaxID=69181 RepID=A0A8S9PS62_BRACR|nr:hypothetical protein F2Q69_00051636 [Brassica cretica]